MKKTFRNLLEGLSEKKERKPIAESDKNWSDSLRKIAKEKQLKSLSRKDRQTLEKIADMMAKANESTDPKGTIKVTKQDKVRYITKDEWNTYRQMGWKQDVKHQDARRAGIGRSGETFRDRQARLGKPQTEAIVEVSARADAMAAIKRDKDFQQVKDVDVKATADDMKLAKKNPIVQLRKILDYKGGTMEFKDKKKLRVKADEAEALLRGFDALQKVQDKY